MFNSKYSIILTRLLAGFLARLLAGLFADLRAALLAHLAGQVQEFLGPEGKVARWQNLIPSFRWIAPGWRAWGRNLRKGRDQILQRSVVEP